MEFEGPVGAQEDENSFNGMEGGVSNTKGESKVGEIEGCSQGG